MTACRHAAAPVAGLEGGGALCGATSALRSCQHVAIKEGADLQLAKQLMNL